MYMETLLINVQISLISCPTLINLCSDIWTLSIEFPYTFWDAETSWINSISGGKKVAYLRIVQTNRGPLSASPIFVWIWHGPIELELHDDGVTNIRRDA